MLGVITVSSTASLIGVVGKGQGRSGKDLRYSPVPLALI